MDKMDNINTIINDNSKYAFIIKQLLKNSIYGRDGNLNTVLHYAAMGGHENLIEYLLEQGINIDIKNDNGDTALHCAALTGNTNIARILLDNGFNINAVNKLNNTPLHCAVMKNRAEVAKLLIENKAAIDIENVFNENILDCIGKDSMFKDCLKLGEFCTVQTRNLNNCLHIVVIRNLIDELDYLFEKKIDFDVENINGYTPVQLATSLGRELIVDKILNKYKNRGLNKLLLIAVEFDQIAMVIYLLNRGADINCRTGTKLTPLLLASKKGYVDILKLLLERDADIYAKNIDNWSVMHFAASEGHEQIVTLFINNKQFIDGLNLKLQTPLILASIEGHVNIVKMFIENGANINIIDADSESAIHYAIKRYASIRHYEIFKLLINNGVKIDDLLIYIAEHGSTQMFEFVLNMDGTDINAIINNNETILLKAVKNSYRDDLVMLVLNKGADVKCVDNELNSSLHYTAKNKNTDIVNALLDMGADIDLKNAQSETALIRAVQAWNHKVAEILLIRGADKDIRDSRDKRAIDYSYSSTPIRELLI